MKLNDDGQLYDGGNECDWYYFKGTSDGPGAMVRGQLINGSKYAFDWGRARCTLGDTAHSG